MNKEELKIILEEHIKWLSDNNIGKRAILRGADLSGADLSGADLDYSCLPLWCGSLKTNMDDRQVKQLLYHVLSIVNHSNNVSDILKEQLLTKQNIEIANDFHRVNESGELNVYAKESEE